MKRQIADNRFLCSLWVALVASGLTASAQVPPAASRSGAGADANKFHLGQLDFGRLTDRQFDLQQTPAQFQPLLINSILDIVPNDYDHTKKWGGTKEIVSGLDVKIRNGKVRTKRRRKEVNHGTWKRYKVSLVDPQEFFQLKVVDLREESPGMAAFDLVVRAKLDVSGRLQEWQRGVRLFSISADAVADVALRLDCRLTTKLDSSHLPPDILMQPKVVDAEAKLVQFKLRRLSKADGPVVREFGDGLEKILRKKLADKNEKLAGKINRQIEKNEDELRISFRDMVSGGLFGHGKQHETTDES